MASSSTSSSSHDATLQGVRWKRLSDAVFEVYRPASNDFSMEIVFFHGFQTEDCNDAYYRTWMKGDNSGCWLDTWLVEYFPHARILSVSYDSSLTVSSSTGRQDMYLLGETLARSLIELGGVGQSCPVVLVGHCVGGMVLKEVCLTAKRFSICETRRRTFPYPYITFLGYVRGAFFYSTPNLGSHIAVRSKLHHGSPLLEHLDLLNKMSVRINSDFATLRHQHGWETYGIVEASETRMQKLLPYCYDMRSSDFEMESPLGSLPFVTEASARADMDSFLTISGINVDHFTICKPESPCATSFLALSKYMENVCKEEIVQQNYKEEQQRSLQLPLRAMELDGRIDSVIKLLQLEKAGPIRLALVGMDGIGKSTLAKQVLIAIRHQFHYTCFLELEDTQQNLEQLMARNLYHQNGHKVEEGQPPWFLFQGKKVLLIVDDVGSEDQISVILGSNVCGEGSRLVITSSRHDWMPDFIVYPVCRLSETASNEFLKAHVEEAVLRSVPKELVSQVVNECDGLPLTLEVIGRYLRDKKEVTIWRGALEKLKTADSLDGIAGGNKIWRKLQVSFHNLAELEQEVFLDLATFDSYGLHRKHYDLNILKSAWGGGCKRDMELVNVGLVNLEQRSFLRVEEVYALKNTCTLQVTIQGVVSTKIVRLHRQLQNMARWISAPVKANLFSWRSLWQLKDVENMLRKCKEEKSQIQVLSIAWEEEIPYENHNINLQVQWSSIGRLDVLRFLRISNIHAVGHDLTLPGSLVLLHMENSTKAAQKKRKWAWWPDNHAWPLCEKNIECLKSLCVLIMEKCSDVHLPENFHTLRGLKILKIDSGALPMKSLPRNFGLLSSLEYLTLNVPLKKLPNSLLELQSLQSLELSGQYLDAWPIPTTVDTYSHLTALTRLQLVNLPALEKLPDSFGGLTSLKHLKLDSCSALKELPEGFGGLQQLRVLQLVNLPALEKLPDSFGGLTSLEHLKLDSCSALEELPEGFGGLQQLGDLQILYCDKLEMLCESFSRLGMLRILLLLDLPSLWQLPARFGYLPSLQELTMCGCPTITELPESFVNLQSICRLQILSCDALESLWLRPEQHGLIPGLKELRFLHVQNCKSFQGLPKSLEQFNLLKRLSVINCVECRYVPASLGQLTSLERLELQGCARVATNSESAAGWRDLLESVVRSSRLHVLRWINCETLSNSIAQFSLLEQLGLYDCENFVGFPDSVAELTALKTVTIRRCQTFTSLPEALGYLPSLTCLILTDCHDLVGLPNSIGLLKSLACLEIQHCNNFVYLPESVGQVTTLTTLRIGICRNLVTLPESICHMTWLKDLSIIDCRPFENMLGQLGRLTRLRTLRFSNDLDMSPLLACFSQLKAIERLEIRCMSCESPWLPEDARRRKVLTQIDESCGCGCRNVLDLLKWVEKYYLFCTHTLKILEDIAIGRPSGVLLGIEVTWSRVRYSEKESAWNKRCYNFCKV